MSILLMVGYVLSILGLILLVISINAKFFPPYKLNRYTIMFSGLISITGILLFSFGSLTL